MSKRPSSPGTEDAATLVRYGEAKTISADEEAAPTVRAAAGDQQAFRERYLEGRLLGEGGMGRVVACLDQRIGREVALKVIQPGAIALPRQRELFEREARVQGQLEHPSIVPVYDLGVGPDGPYFTMRRVRGRTLESVIAGVAAENAEDVARYSRHRMLTAFVQLAQAVAFAHARGIVHRDLKPSNVMLGDYGEVYVLDWGIAKATRPTDPKVSVINLGAQDEETQRGQMVGTPGYMAPEQVLGDQLDIRADVYALGAVLFELLTLEPLLGESLASDAKAVFEATLTGVDARPSARAPQADIPPEFDAICERATHLDPERRHPSARELAEEVEAWLAGDRDVELRREMARSHVAAAGRALANDPDASGRSRAIGELNRAIALDPANDEVLSQLARLLLAPTQEEIPEVLEAFAEEDRQERRYLAKLGTISFTAWLALSPLLLWPGIRSWTSWFATIFLLTAAGTACAIAYFKRQLSTPMGFVILLSSTAAMGALGMLLGPFVLVPALAAQNTIYFAAFARSGAQRAVVVGIGTLAILGPYLLERTGILSPSMRFAEGAMTLLPRMTNLDRLPIEVMLIVGSVVMVILPSLMLARMNDRRLELKLRHLSHLWHLGQLVPTRVRDVRPEPGRGAVRGRREVPAVPE
jgi:eukaryotic-like serine/threonine-protein kinase